MEGGASGPALLPKEALNFLPPPHAIRMGEPIGPKSVRLIFGDLKFDEHEHLKVTELKVELRKRNFRSEGTIFSNDRYLLRFLQGNEWDIEKCIEDMHRHLEWRKETFPLVLNNIYPALAKGYCYIHGRDKCLRPILIIRCEKLQHCDHNEALMAIVYWLEFIINKMLVKNRVEQWSVIVDLKNCAVHNTPITVLKDVVICLSRNYRGRLRSLSIINTPIVFWGIWKLVSLILPYTTRQKVSIYTSDFKRAFLEAINSNQLEVQFGGTRSTVEVFNLPHLPPGPYN